MPFVALVPNYAANGTAASGSGLTGLDQSGANFSIAFWYRWRTGELVFLWWHLSGTSPIRNGVAVRANGSTSLRLTLATGSGVTNVDASNVLVAGWHHYAVVYNGSYVVFYRDGWPVARVAATTVPTATTNATGIAGLNSQMNWLFDVQVYPNVALTAGDIWRLADPRLPPAGGCKQRLARSWVPSAGGTMYDESGNGNNMTLHASLEYAQSGPPPEWERFLEARKKSYRGVLLFTATFTGGITPSGSLLKDLARTVAGAMTPSGALTYLKVILRTFTGDITPTGTLTRQLQRTVTGVVTPAGALWKATTRLLTGGLTSSGLLRKLTGRTVAGSVAPTGALVRQPQKVTGGTVAPSGTVSRSLARTLTGSVTPTGAVRRLLARTFSGVVGLVGTVINQIVRLVVVRHPRQVAVLRSSAAVTNVEPGGDVTVQRTQADARLQWPE